MPRANPRRTLPLLKLTVASPCKEAWEDMAGNDRVRFCGHCAKHVYNLSAMLLEEARELLQAQHGDVCVRMFQRADGTVMTEDCPVGARRKWVRRVATAAAAGALLAAETVSVASARKTTARCQTLSTMGAMPTMGEVDGVSPAPIAPAIMGSVVAPPASPPVTGGPVGPPRPVMGGLRRPDRLLPTVGRIPPPKRGNPG